MNQPVLFFCFANQSEEPLADLAREDQAINNIITPFALEHKYFIHREQLVTRSGLISKLVEFRNRVSIFHYSGHASRSAVDLTDEAADGQSLVDLLAHQKNLKFVFLNGCNTSGFIKKLIDNGVGAILATSKEVDDNDAFMLAELFYKSLCQGSTLEEAFDIAKEAVETKAIETRKISRGIVLPEEDTADFEWGLYSKNPEALKWTLKDAAKDLNPIPIFKMVLIFITIGFFVVWWELQFGSDKIPLIGILVGMASLVILLRNTYARILPGINRVAESVLSFSLRTGFLIPFVLLIALVTTSLSSVRIPVPLQAGFEPTLLTPDDEKARFTDIIEQSDKEETKLIALINPVSRHHRLAIDGYEPLDFSYGLFGTSIDKDSLVPNPTILIRLSPIKIFEKLIHGIRISCNNQECYFKHDSLPDAMLLGNAKIKIPENGYENWTLDLQQEDPSIRGSIIKRWKVPVVLKLAQPLSSDDLVRIDLLDLAGGIVESTEIDLSNNHFNDVLLH